MEYRAGPWIEHLSTVCGPASRHGKRTPAVYRHLDVLSKTLDEGVDVRGCIAWSLVDTFEWATG
jgi:hypothetical protein